MSRILVFFLVVAALLTTADLSIEVARSEELPSTQATSDVQVTGKVSNPDSSPAGNVKVSIHARGVQESVAECTTDPDGKFELTIKMKREIVAQSAFFRIGNNELLAMRPLGVVSENKLVLPEEPYAISLAPAVKPVVTVVDANDQPVADATVIAQLGAYMMRVSETTNDDGEARFVFPESVDVMQLLAWKDESGFEHRSFEPSRGSNDVNAVVTPKFNRAGERIKLTGASTLRIRVVDADGNSIADEKVYPWLLNPPESIRTLNLSFYPEVQTHTDEFGVATFRWIPIWQSRPITFWNSGSGEYTHRRISVRADASADEDGIHGTIHIDKLVPLTGRVLANDEQPAANVTVSISGESDERHFADVATDESGRYEALVPPNMVYLLTAKRTIDGEIVEVADTVSGFAVFPKTPYEATDLVLRRPTIVSGTVKDNDGNAVVDQSVTFYHYGIPARELPEDQKSKLPGEQSYSGPILFYYAKTDANGRFELGLGNGNYDVRPPGQHNAEKFEIVDDQSLKFELFVKPTEVPQDSFTGNVVAPDGSPVPQAAIEAVGDQFSRGWRTQTDGKGAFAVKEHRQRKTLIVTTPDRLHAAMVLVDQEATNTQITVQPVGNATFILVDNEGDPIAHQQVTLSVTLHRSDRGGFLSRDVGSNRSDETGTVRFAQLIPAMMYRLSPTAEPRENRHRVLHSFKVQPGEDYQTKVTVDSSPVPPVKTTAYQPPTTEERLQRLLDVKGTPIERFEKAVSKADVYQQKLLLVIGDSQVDALKQWTEMRYGDSDYGKISSDYSTMVFAIDHVDPSVFSPLATQLKIQPDSVGAITLLMISGQGDVIERANESDLMVDGKLSRSAVLEFLQSHPIELPAARDHLNAALAEAKRDRKRVFVQETATWCGPCHLLTDFMLANRVWDVDYVYVRMDHRMEGAFEIMKEMRDGAQGGIPWFAILDSEGEKLATSNHFRNEENIGYPNSESGQEHFASMLKKTALRLTENEINDFVAALSISP